MNFKTILRAAQAGFLDAEIESNIGSGKTILKSSFLIWVAPTRAAREAAFEQSFLALPNSQGPAGGSAHKDSLLPAGLASEA